MTCVVRIAQRCVEIEQYLIDEGYEIVVNTKNSNAAQVVVCPTSPFGAAIDKLVEFLENHGHIFRKYMPMSFGGGGAELDIGIDSEEVSFVSSFRFPQILLQLICAYEMSLCCSVYR